MPKTLLRLPGGQRGLDDLVHVVVPVLAQTPADEHLLFSLRNSPVLLTHRAVGRIVTGAVGFVPLFPLGASIRADDRPGMGRSLV